MAKAFQRPVVPETPPTPLLGNLQEARTTLQNFWGHTDGSDDALDAVEAKLEGLKLTKKELRGLRVRLPTAMPGSTNHGKISRLDFLIQNMIEEA